MAHSSHAGRHWGQPQIVFSGRRRLGDYSKAMELQRQGLEAEAQRGVGALEHGDFPTARDAFAHVTSSPDASTQAWLLYAQACDGCDDRVNALVALERVL